MKNLKNQRPVKEYYDEESDIKWMIFKEGPEAGYIEVAPGINVEVNDENEPIGLEVMNYSKRTLGSLSSTIFNQPTFEITETAKVSPSSIKRLDVDEEDMMSELRAQKLAKLPKGKGKTLAKVSREYDV